MRRYGGVLAEIPESAAARTASCPGNHKTEEDIMNYDRKYLVWALGYAAVGMALGIVMAASKSHAQFDTHAHLLLVGFVVSLAYAVIHKLWLGGTARRLAGIQFAAHQAGAVIMASGLFLLYGNHVPAASLDAVLGIASIAVFAAAVLMIFMVLKSKTAGT
jgi:hypothetical protein